ncbi:MAG: flippase-like domain-containing protein [Candidatus Cloacimonetes bacterium]|nr:flippase-like domain-containing protein [Candidatus Cloacimonadota bacterium]
MYNIKGVVIYQLLQIAENQIMKEKEDLPKVLKTEENLQISKKRIFSYIFSGFIFLLISFFSIMFVYNQFGGKTYLLRFDFFSLSIICQLIILLLLYFAFDGLRLYYVLKTMQQSISFKEIIKLVFINILFSNVTPMATGGGFAQIYFLHKNNISIGMATAATTIRTTLASMFLFISTPMILIFWKIPGFSTEKTYLYVAILITVYFLFYYILLRKNKLLKKVLLLVFKLLRSIRIISQRTNANISRKSIKEINAFSGSLSLFIKGNKSCMILSVLFTFFFLLSLFSFSIILLKGLGYQISYFTVIFYQIVVTFFMYFTPTPGATGLAEGGYALLFSQFVEKTDIVPLLFFWRFFTIYIGMITGLGVFYWEFMKKHAKKKKNT